MIDKYFRVEVISQTPNPQQTIYAAMHQDYTEGFVWNERQDWPSEEKCGGLVVRNLLKGGKGHWGPLEHPQIVLNAGWFPHSTMQQLRTHRHLSFDVQSGRYSGKRIIDVVDGKRDLEEVIYCRPAGEYTDRQGKKYEYNEGDRFSDLEWCRQACARYERAIVNVGMSEEHARDMFPFAIRQHWVVSANLRALCHLLAVRGNLDAQLEAQQFCELCLLHFKAWAPQIYEYFESKIWQKARLAP